MPTIKLELYLHGNKSDNVCILDERCEELGLLMMSENARTNFAYALYEVKFELEVDHETGEYTIIKASDRKEEPHNISYRPFEE